MIQIYISYVTLNDRNTNHLSKVTPVCRLVLRHSPHLITRPAVMAIFHSLKGHRSVGRAIAHSIKM